MKWQPIETAPEDTPVLIFDGNMICVAEFSKYWKGHAGDWDCVGAGGYEWDNTFDNPTHWMPLPDAPK